MTEHVPEHRADTNEEPLVGDAPPRANVLLSSSVYDKLKSVAQIWLPALSVLYLALAPLWGLPLQEQVAGTIMALDLFLGAVLGIATRQYFNSDARFDGQILVEPSADNKTTDLNVSLDPEAVATKKEIVVKIDRA